jgi:hypothetical protein
MHSITAIFFREKSARTESEAAVWGGSVNMWGGSKNFFFISRNTK